MSPLRAVRLVRTRAFHLSPPPSVLYIYRYTCVPPREYDAYGPLNTSTNGSKSDKNERANLPHGPFIDNAPGWNEDLATPSEAFVKADRERTQSVDEMQLKTVNYLQAHHDPEAAQTQASYDREEIGGPLGHAGMGEFEGVVGHDDLGPDAVQVEANGRVVSRHLPVGSDKTAASEGL